MVSIAIENTWARVTNATDADIRWLDGILCYESWSNNGIQTYRLYDNFNKRFPAGLVPQVMKRAVQDKFEGIVLTDSRIAPCSVDPQANLSWLRDYQIEAIDTLVRRTRGILHLPTGSGKTEIAVGLTQKLPCRWLMLAHRAMLTENVADRYNMRTGAKAGRIADGVWEEGDGALVCATFQALAAGIKKGNKSTLGLILGAEGIIVDECFPPGTLVDGRPIETYKPGDYVTSFDKAGNLVAGRVVRLYQNPLRGNLVRIRAGGSQVTATETHKFWTQAGWVEARDLTAQHSILRSNHAASYRQDSSVQRVCQDISGQQVVLGRPPQQAQVVNDLQQGLPHKGTVSALDGHCPEGRADACSAHACEKPHDRAGEYREDAPFPTRTRGLVSESARRQWEGSDQSAGTISTALGVADRSVCLTRPAREWQADELQDRHRRSDSDDCNRGGRPDTRVTARETDRRPQSQSTTWARVDSVEILERGSVVRPGGLCPEGTVFNLNVEDEHTYFAEGLGVSNCHVAPADSYRRIIGMARNAYWRCGLSGTPLSRTDHRSVFAIGSIGRVVYRVKTDVLISAGLISKPTIVMRACTQTSEKEEWSAVHRELIVNSKVRNQLVLDMVKEAPKPCIVFVSSLRHGKALTKAIQATGLKSEFVDGKSSLDVRKRAVKRLEDCSVEALVATTIFNEGIDIPDLRAVVIAAGGASAIQTLQRIGRGMRRTEDKDTFYVYDIADKGHPWTTRHTQSRASAYRSEGHEVTTIK